MPLLYTCTSPCQLLPIIVIQFSSERTPDTNSYQKRSVSSCPSFPKGCPLFYLQAKLIWLCLNTTGSGMVLAPSHVVLTYACFFPLLFRCLIETSNAKSTDFFSFCKLQKRPSFIKRNSLLMWLTCSEKQRQLNHLRGYRIKQYHWRDQITNGIDKAGISQSYHKYSYC